MNSRTRLYGILLLVGVLFAAALFYTIYTYELNTGSTDFFPTWKATELFFKEGVDPYSERIGIESQNQIYGKLAEPDQDPFLFFYPFYVMFYFAPLAVVGYDVASALYMTILIISLVAAFGFQLSILRWLPPPILFGEAILFTIVAYFSVRGILLAQHAILGYVLHIVGLWGLLRKRESLAGIALALSTIKPQTGFLIVPFMLLWAWRYGQRRVVVAFAITFGLLCGISFILQPSWFSDWIGQVTTYEGSTETVAAAEVVSHAVESLPNAVKTGGQLTIIILLGIPVLMAWKRILWDGHKQEILWGYCLTITYSLTIAPRVATTYYVEMYFVLIIAAMILNQQRRNLWSYIGAIVLLIGYWVLHIQTVPPAVEKGDAGSEAPIVYVVFPVLIWGLLYLFREQFPAYNSLASIEKDSVNA